MAVSFRSAFVGHRDKGLDVLLENFKNGGASLKYLSDYLQERIVLEEGFLRSLEKLAKPPRFVFASTASPAWNVLQTMALDIILIHQSLRQNLTDTLSKIKPLQDKQKEAQTLLKPKVQGVTDELSALEALFLKAKEHAAVNEALIREIEELEAAKKAGKSKDKGDAKLLKAKQKLAKTETDLKTATSEYDNCREACQSSLQTLCDLLEKEEVSYLEIVLPTLQRLMGLQAKATTHGQEIEAIAHTQLNQFTIAELLESFVQSRRDTAPCRPLPNLSGLVKSSHSSVSEISRESAETTPTSSVAPSTPTPSGSQTNLATPATITKTPKLSLLKRLTGKGKSAKKSSQHLSSTLAEVDEEQAHSVSDQLQVDEQGFTITAPETPGIALDDAFAKTFGSSTQSRQDSSDSSDDERVSSQRTISVKIRDKPTENINTESHDHAISSIMRKLGGESESSLPSALDDPFASSPTPATTTTTTAITTSDWYSSDFKSSDAQDEFVSSADAAVDTFRATESSHHRAGSIAFANSSDAGFDPFGWSGNGSQATGGFGDDPFAVLDDFSSSAQPQFETPQVTEFSKPAIDSEEDVASPSPQARNTSYQQAISTKHVRIANPEQATIDESESDLFDGDDFTVELSDDLPKASSVVSESLSAVEVATNSSSTESQIQSKNGAETESENNHIINKNGPAVPAIEFVSEKPATNSAIPVAVIESSLEDKLTKSDSNHSTTTSNPALDSAVITIESSLDDLELPSEVTSKIEPVDETNAPSIEADHSDEAGNLPSQPDAVSQAQATTEAVHVDIAAPANANRQEPLIEETSSTHEQETEGSEGYLPDVADHETEGSEGFLPDIAHPDVDLVVEEAEVAHLQKDLLESEAAIDDDHLTPIESDSVTPTQTEAPHPIGVVQPIFTETAATDMVQANQAALEKVVQSVMIESGVEVDTSSPETDHAIAKSEQSVAAEFEQKPIELPAVIDIEQPILEVEHIAVESDQAIVDIEQPAAVVEIEQPVVELEQPTAEVEHIAVESEQAAVKSEQAIVEIEQKAIEQPTAEVEHIAVESEYIAVESDQAIVESEQSCAVEFEQKPIELPAVVDIQPPILESDRQAAAVEHTVVESEQPASAEIEQQPVVDIEQPVVESEQPSIVETEQIPADSEPGQVEESEKPMVFEQVQSTHPDVDSQTLPEVEESQVSASQTNEIVPPSADQISPSLETTQASQSGDAISSQIDTLAQADGVAENSTSKPSLLSSLPRRNIRSSPDQTPSLLQSSPAHPNVSNINDSSLSSPKFASTPDVSLPAQRSLNDSKLSPSTTPTSKISRPASHSSAPKPITRISSLSVSSKSPRPVTEAKSAAASKTTTPSHPIEPREASSVREPETTGAPTVSFKLMIQEVVDANFRGAFLSKCTMKTRGVIFWVFGENAFAPGTYNQSVKSLKFKIRGATHLAELIPAHSFITVDAEDPATFHMATEDLRLLLEQAAPNGGSKLISILKYTTKQTGSQATPLRWKSLWKPVRAATSQLKLDYSPNTHFPGVLSDVRVKLITEDADTCERRPDGEWNAVTHTLTWALAKIAPSSAQGSLHAEFTAPKVAPKPVSVFVTFNCVGTNISGIEFLFAKQALLSMDVVDKSTRAGVYRVDP